jgi:hypothetical protein
MKKHSSFTLDLPHTLFWDVDLENFDNIRNRRLIIERVVTLGDLADLKEIIRFYGLRTIKEEIVKAGNLDNKTLAWASLFLDIPKTHFRCYMKRRSNKAHWNY